MGNNVLSSLSVADPFHPTPQGLCLLLLSDFYHIYALKCPPEVIRAVHEAVGAAAIKREGSSSKAQGLQKFTLRDWLWYAGGANTMDTRRVVMNILEAVEQAGWEVVDEVDLSRRHFLQGWVLRRIDGDEGSNRGRNLMVGFHDTDDVRMLLADEPLRVSAVQDAIRGGISRAWKISKESEYAGAYEFKLKGRPFLAGGVDTVAARQMVLGMCEELERARGYLLSNTYTLSARQGSQSSLVFKIPSIGQDEYGRGGRSSTYLGISLNSGDDIRLIPAPGEPLDFVARDEIGRGIAETWPRGVQKEGMPPTALRTLPPPPVLCLSLHTYDRVRLTSWDLPTYQWMLWRVRDGMTALAAGLVILTMIDALRELGWELKASLDVSGKCLGGGGVVLLTVVYCPFPSLFFAPQWDASVGLCALALCGMGALYGLKCPEEVEQAVRNSLGRRHLKGDGLSDKAKGLHKFKLASKLWMANGKKTVEVRRVLMRMIEELQKVRWEVVEDVDMSRSGFLQMLILRRREGDDFERPHRKDFVVGLHGSDDVRILCEDEATRVFNITEAARIGIESSWKIAREGDYGGAHEFVLKGRPFGSLGAIGEDSVKSC
ncbi:hypothetical protein FOZ60_010767 [Perkinsus olseni]|uniref:Uncharacterized protein n=1 Tax=Perkinsus olseni TaxID=32597 RepID=A0A7J6NET7_PEROL|nr:hypothetical protein FOZ60_010767 [Perkinsus olseni]